MSIEMISRKKILNDIYKEIVDRSKVIKSTGEEVRKLALTIHDIWDNAEKLYFYLSRIEQELSTIIGYNIASGSYKVEFAEESEESSKTAFIFIPFRRSESRKISKKLDELLENYTIIRKLLIKIINAKKNPDIAYLIKKTIIKYDLEYLINQTLNDSIRLIDAVLNAWKILLNKLMIPQQLEIKTRRKT